jgi:glucokinase
VEVAALDIGGTHARLAIARIGPDGAITLGEPVTLMTGDFVGLEQAWAAFAQALGRPLPRAAAIALAAPVSGPVLRMTNGTWVIEREGLEGRIGLDAVSVINDFGAVAHAVARLPEAAFDHLCGPEQPLPARSTISVLGPGTGLGVAHLHRFDGGYRVQPTEGAHIAFGPVDAFDDALIARLRPRWGRVSLERIVSGPGLAEIVAALGGAEPDIPDADLWQRGLSGADSLAAEAVSRFCLSLGSAAGDYALAHGASGVVIAGGLAQRLRGYLLGPEFAERFRQKGRYEAMLSQIPVYLLTHPQPGLYGAVAAFRSEHPA